jgi:lysophospholipase L1-like esterase
MKKYFIASLILNVLFICLAGFAVYKKGGMKYLEAKTSQLRGKELQTDFKIDNHWRSRVSLFEVIPIDSNDIVFIGNSITERCEWSELFHNGEIINRGISGDATTGVMQRLFEVTQCCPRKIFLEIGINDLLLKKYSSEIASNIDSIVSIIEKDCPVTKLYILSVLPVNNWKGLSNDTIQILNHKIKNIANSRYITFIDLYPYFVLDNNLKPNYYFDGLHLNGSGYLLLRKILEPYLN